ncbi:MAG: type IV pilus assembly protein PilM, partial [Actinomycetia bacterium]|nr:type IV pilus assembly protein PilM [Actinomycetes bacterium]
TSTISPSIKVPVGAVIEGEIVDVEAAAYVLRQLWKTAGFTTKDVIIGLASQRVVVRLVNIPYMNQAELAGAIQFQAQDYIPIPIEEAIIDAQMLNEYLGENDEKMMEVLLVAAQKDMVNNTVAAVEAAGLKPQTIDLSAFAIVRALLGDDNFFLPEAQEDSEAGTAAAALINISSDLTNIVVVEKGTPRFARVTPLAGNDLTQAIADSLSLSFDEAEELKIKVGLPNLDGSPMVPPEDLAENLKVHIEAAQSIMESQASHFVAEIRRSLDYYLTQATQIRSITRLVLSGAGAKLNNFAEYIERGLQAKVETGTPLAQVQASQKLPAERLGNDELSMAVSLGLALRSFQ